MKRPGISTGPSIVGLLTLAIIAPMGREALGQAAYETSGYAVSQPTVTHGATASGPRTISQRALTPAASNNNTWVSANGSRSAAAQVPASPAWKPTPSGARPTNAHQLSQQRTSNSPWMRQAGGTPSKPTTPAWSTARQGSNSTARQSYSPRPTAPSRQATSIVEPAEFVTPTASADPFESSAAQQLRAATSRATRPANPTPAKTSRPRKPRTLEARPEPVRPRHSLGTYNPLEDARPEWSPVVRASYSQPSYEELPPAVMMPDSAAGPGCGPGCDCGPSCDCEPTCDCGDACEPGCGCDSGYGYDPMGGDSIFDLCFGTFGGRHSDGCTCGDCGCGDELSCACEPGCEFNPGCGDACEPGCGCDSGCSHQPGCIGDGCDWIFVPVPVPRYRHLDLYAGVQGFKGPLDINRDRGNFGFHEGFNLTRRMPLSPWPSLAMQIGYEATQSQLSGSDVGANDDSHSQSFVTLGGFRRTHRGVQFGAVWDILQDERTGTTEEFHQFRGEIGIVGHRGHEIGLATAIGTNDEIINSVEFGAINQYLAYYRVNGPKGSEGRIYGGFAEDEQAVLGADFRLPVKENWSVQGSFGYLIPEGGSAGLGSEREAWNVGLGLVWHTYGRAHRGRCDDGMFRPLFNVADNGTMFVTGTPVPQTPQPPAP